jgi:hypothetical protein
VITPEIISKAPPAIEETVPAVTSPPTIDITPPIVAEVPANCPLVIF